MTSVKLSPGPRSERLTTSAALGVAVLFHEPGDVVATAPAAGLALDREGGKSESVCAWSLMLRGGLGLMRVVWLAAEGWPVGGGNGVRAKLC